MDRTIGMLLIAGIIATSLYGQWIAKQTVDTAHAMVQQTQVTFFKT